jgi:DNA-binding transcriptional LysR family regulator
LESAIRLTEARCLRGFDVPFEIRFFEVVSGRNRSRTPATQKAASSTPPAPPLRLEIVDLETFNAVVGLGSFSAAARHLNITQPSVTGRVQRLEKALCVKLLVRTTRRVELTWRGTLLRAEAERTLEGLRGLVDRFRLDAGAARNRVIVAATQMVSATMLPDVLRSHRERYPGIDVQVRDLRHGDAVKAIAAGDADLGVIHFDGADKRLRSQPLRTEEIVLVVPPSHPLAKSKRATLDAMAAFPLMMLEQYEGIKERIAAEVARHGLELKPALSAGNLTTLMGMLDAGMGILLLPRVMARHSLQAGHIIVEIEGNTFRRTFSLVMAHDSKPSLVVRRFCRHLRQELSTTYK